MKVSGTLYEERIKICKECDKFDKTFSRCKKCGCLMKVKARFKNSKCPLNKWKWQHTES